MIKISWSVRFLLAMIVLYITTAIFDKEFVNTITMDFLKSMLSILPILLIAYALMLLMNIFLKPEKIKAHLGHDSGIKGWIYSILAGIIIPSPPYIIFPILGDLKKHGMKNSLIVSFLYSRYLHIAFLPVMVYYFGLQFTIVISIYILLFSIISGKLMGRLYPD